MTAVARCSSALLRPNSAAFHRRTSSSPHLPSKRHLFDVICSTAEATSGIEDHQVTAALGKPPAVALVISSALMLSTPLKALAETCEADGSFFNMPLLLFVALTGATVGGASLQRQGKYKEAIKYHSMVLKISEQQVENSGNAEAYGAIADCFTELGELEQAGKFYDKYISRLQSD